MFTISLSMFLAIASSRAGDFERLVSLTKVNVPTENDQILVVAVAESTRVKNRCTWAAGKAFSAAWKACDEAKYESCESLPRPRIEKFEGLCRVTNIMHGTKSN